MKKLLLTTQFAVLSIAFLFAQLQIDKPLNFSGSGTDAKVTGIKDVSGAQDAVSAEVIQQGSLTYALATGTNAYAITLSPAITSYATGMTVNFIAANANTAASTLNVNGLGARAIKKAVSNDLVAGDLAAGQAASVMYDGTNFQLLSGLGGSAFGNVPVGTIMAWNKSFPNTPALPSGWLECNGQTVSDAESPYNGLTLPDLNSTGRFLRGGATSGVLQADALGSHSHTVTDPGHTHSVDPANTSVSISDPGHFHTTDPPNTTVSVSDPGHSHSVNPPNTGVAINDPGHSHGVSYNGNFIAQSPASCATGGFSSGGLYAFCTGYGSLTVNGAGTGISAAVDIGNFASASATTGVSASVNLAAVNSNTKTTGITGSVNIPATASTSSTTGITVGSSGGSETRPINMSVVWIMRVK